MSAIDARINYEGTEQGADQIERLLRSLHQLVEAQERTTGAVGGLEQALRDETAAAQRAGQQLGEAATGAKKLGDDANASAIKIDDVANRLGAISQAASQFGGVLKSLDPDLAAAADALGAVGAAAGAGGAAFGPYGAIVGGLLGGLQALVQHLDRVEEAHLAAAAAARQQVTDLDLLQERMGNQDRIERLYSGLGTVEEQTRALTDAQRDLDAQQERLRNTQVELSDAIAERTNLEGLLTGAMGGGREATARLTAQYDALQARIRSLNADVRGFTVSMETQQQNTIELAGGLFEAQNRERDTREEEQRRRRRAARRPQRDTLADEILTDLDEIETRRELAAEAEAAHEQRMLDYLEERRLAKEELDTKDREAAQHRMDEIQRLAALEREKLEGQREAEERANEQRLEQAREITGAIEGTLQQVASAYIDAFGQAIEGQKTLEQAALEATKALLKSIGEEMVALGIKETLEGFANIVANPPVAATKIPMGIALIAAGAGLGAAGAAIPSQPAAPAERPRADEDRGGGGGNQTLVLNYNSPIISTGTASQLTRQIGRQIRDGAPFPTRSAA